MSDIPTIAFVGLPLLTGFVGAGLGYWVGNAPSDEGYWVAIASREGSNAFTWQKRASESERKFVGAAKECNRIQDELDEANAENRRLQGHIDNMRALFAELVEQGRKSTSGTAQSMATKAKAGLAK